MAAVETVTLEVPDPPAADAFYAAFGLGPRVGVRASSAPTTGFRGYTLSLVVAQPSTVDSLIGTALDGGATTLTEAGHEGVLGLRRCRAGPGRGDLEGRHVFEEGHRSGHPGGRRRGAAARRRRCEIPRRHRVARIVIGGDAGPFTDPDGFVWEADRRREPDR